MVRADTFNKRTQEVTVERRKTRAEVNIRRLRSVSNGTYSNRSLSQPLIVCSLRSLGSGPRYQILSHVFARCASQKTHGQARIARETCDTKKKCDTNHIPRATA